MLWTVHKRGGCTQDGEGAASWLVTCGKQQDWKRRFAAVRPAWDVLSGDGLIGDVRTGLKMNRSVQESLVSDEELRLKRFAHLLRRDTGYNGERMLENEPEDNSKTSEKIPGWSRGRIYFVDIYLWKWILLIWCLFSLLEQFPEHFSLFNHIHLFTHWWRVLPRKGLTQGHFDMWPDGESNLQTSNRETTTLPPE